MAVNHAAEMIRIRRLVAQFAGGFPDLDFLLEYHDCRVAELLRANSELVSERNVAISRAEHFQSAVDFLLRHNAVEQARQLQKENSVLRTEREGLLHRALVAEANFAVHSDAIERARVELPVSDAARKWWRSVEALERARKQGGGESILQANRAITEAFLALRAVTKIAFGG